MNLLFDGFELFTSLNVGIRGGNVVSFIANVLTRTSGGQSIAGFSAVGTYTRNLSATSSSHVFAGIAFIPKSTTTARASTACNFILYDGSTAQVGWRINDDGSISIYRGATNAATLIGSTAAGVCSVIASPTSSDFKMIEIEVVFATGATGSVKLRVADIEVLSVATVQTANSGSAQCTRVDFSTEFAAVGVRNEIYDDMYLNDDSGSAPANTYFGEAFVVEEQVPNAVGTYAEWTKGGSIGANNFNQVDDYHNSDTDYISSDIINQRDAYNSASLVSSVIDSIVGIEHNMVARKDDVASREVSALYRTGGSDFVGTANVMTGTYALFLERKMVNPDTGVAWTESEINALEHGIKLTT